jgi:hypothetical protein
MVDVFYLCYLIWVQVQNIQFIQVLQISNPLDVVLTKHQHSKGGDCVKMSYFFYLIIVQVEENEIW